MSFEETEALNSVQTDEITLQKSFTSSIAESVKSPRKKRRKDSTDSSDSSDVEDTNLYCICQQKDDGKFMISCEECQNWFHGRCVGMSKEKSRKTPKWFCPECGKKDKNAKWIAENFSPAENKQKERNTTVTHKRVKSSSGTAAASTVLSEVRSRVVQGIQKVLENGYKCLLDVDVNKSEQEFRLSDDVGESIPTVAKQIEHAMHSTLAGDSYKEKFRSLHFNLKDAKNVFNVLSGKITPERLVTMSAEDLANEHLKVQKILAEEESLRNTVITEDMATVILKKTHKGEVAVEKKLEITTDIVDPVSSMISMPSAIPPEYSPVTAIVPRLLPVEEVAEHSGDSESPSEQSEAMQISTTTSRAPSPQKLDPTSSLDALLAKVKSDHISVKPVASLDNTIIQTAASPLAPAKPSWPAMEFLQGEPVIWKGVLDQFEVGAKQVGGPLLDSEIGWHDLMMENLQIAGRINHESVYKYLEEQTVSDHRRIAIVVFEPVDNDVSLERYKVFWHHYHSKQRFAVVKCSLPRVKDMYVLSLPKNVPVPTFMLSVDQTVPPRAREADLLLGVIVYMPTEEVRRIASLPVTPAMAPVALGANISHLLQTLTPLMRPPAPAPAQVYQQPVYPEFPVVQYQRVAAPIPQNDPWNSANNPPQHDAWNTGTNQQYQGNSWGSSSPPHQQRSQYDSDARHQYDSDSRESRGGYRGRGRGGRGRGWDRDKPYQRGGYNSNR